MEAFGDVSGNFRSLIKHECEVVVVGVVMATDRVAAARCPKRTVRDVQNVDEAKWNELTDVQKRRMIECLSGDDSLEFGYTLFKADHLHQLEYNYLLHQDVSVPEPWDLALIAYAYTEILFQPGADELRRLLFYFDGVAWQKQANRVSGKIQHLVDLEQLVVSDSAQVKGVQAADCFAGAVAEDERHGTDYLGEFPADTVTEAVPGGLVQLEQDLRKYDKNQARR